MLYTQGSVIKMVNFQHTYLRKQREILLVAVKGCIYLLTKESLSSSYLITCYNTSASQLRSIKCHYFLCYSGIVHQVDLLLSHYYVYHYFKKRSQLLCHTYHAGMFICSNIILSSVP